MLPPDSCEGKRVSIDKTAVRNDRSGWEDRARRWLAFDQDMEAFAAPLGELALAKLQLVHGERVLDVGCGTGGSIASLADAVGPAGQVTAIDISAAMTARARQNTARFDNVDIICGDAGQYQFDSSFDAVFSRFGVMFFSSPETAFSNLRLALRPGGRLAFVSWADIKTNDFYMISGLAVLAVTRTSGEHPGNFRSTPFSLSDPSYVADLLSGAGFCDIEVIQQIVQTVMTEPELERQLRLSITVTGLREMLEELPEGTRQEAADAIRRSLWARVRDGKISLRVGVLITVARR
jgi:ubiquinone/menaquinone biosynthesis C-methylase UbiE